MGIHEDKLKFCLFYKKEWEGDKNTNFWVISIINLKGHWVYPVISNTLFASVLQLNKQQQMEKYAFQWIFTVIIG